MFSVILRRRGPAVVVPRTRGGRLRASSRCPLDDPRYTTATLALHRVGDAWFAELSHQAADDQAQVAPVRDLATFDLDELRGLQLDADAYGRALARQALGAAALRERFRTVEATTAAAGRWLRLSIRIDPSAQELHALRWELLRHPDTHAPLATSERVLLSRFMVAHDWRPVTLRARSDLRALIAVSAPPPDALARAQLAPVDVDGEVGRARAALAGMRVDVLGGPGRPVTVDTLVAALRGGVDVLYFVSHGSFARSTGLPMLFLQNDDGSLKPTRGDEVAARIGELQVGPRLVVLASCQSAGDGNDRPNVHGTFATALAEAGVPAVIAMQGFITMATVEAMMPVLFTELGKDGQIDRALAVARGAVRDRPDQWMPALFLRLTGGRLWYQPGFVDGKDAAIWKRLLKPVREGKLVPIVGTGLQDRLSGTSFEVARALAKKHGFPLADRDWDDLPRVTQYLTVKESRFNALRAAQDQLVVQLLARHADWLPEAERQAPRLARLLAVVAERQRRDDPDDPYAILAALPASVYVNTTLDPALSWALTEAGRRPRAVLSRWRHQRAPAPGAPAAEVDRANPLVYQVFGAWGKDTDDTIVLTEDDHFDFLLGTAADRLIPAEVESALVDNSLLLLGFRLTDWSFRVLFRLMMSLPGRERLKQYCHVAVQLDPELHTLADVEGAKAYLAEYFGKEANVDIYWGSSREFLVQLRDELARAGAPETPAKEAADDWDF